MRLNKDSMLVLNLLAIAVVLLSLQNLLHTPTNHDPNYEPREANEIKSPGIGVATDHPAATEVGMEVLRRGGNAVDAAIAISYSLGVVEPFASGIGGGGIMLVHPAEDVDPIIYDYREKAPDQKSKPESGIGVPGFVMGMDEIHEDFGSRSMERLLAPAIHQAENGLQVSSTLHSQLLDANHRIPPNEASLFYPDNRAIEEGKTLKQEELAKTMTAIREEGPDIFYEGEIASQLVRKVDGIEQKDLENYEVEKTEPIKGEFAGFDVYTPPPPAGGTMLIQSLQMAEQLHVDQLEDRPTNFIQMIGEINRETYEDRLETIGDPEFVDMPLDEISSQEYTENLASNISSVGSVNEEPLEDYEGDKDGNTTHFVVVDQDGMIVSVTNTLSSFFGSGIFTNGFFLNNQLDNFSSDSSSPNAYEPGKRPFSYISPTVLSKNGTPLIGIGSAGGRRITSTLTQVLSRHLLFEEPINEAIDENRSYRDLHEEKIYLEGRIPPPLQQQLEENGYSVDNSRSPFYFGSIQSLTIDYNEENVYGGTDPRRNGKWMSR
ncbi:gamma-glutamyltranspeptidase/glutathione hydrolase [Geomicrobium halophilum]|uniref:Glutathione hydrolase proenzyme n=1 Tax=Geomicrobium halophilum TaxID=549000 RepID=A0A841Q1R8_9BACL|nr:gamma-glutamyltransferase [Geomicrobium halophilum]MBB6449948.1 gamma-glutamyltranspeptidase/glutathione hydrolase [Geomicrobium halophilum]